MKRQDARDASRLSEPDELLDRCAAGYKGQVVGEGCLDLLVGERLVVELKAVKMLAPIHWVEVRSYLKAAGCALGLLINFNVPVLLRGVRRVILTGCCWRPGVLALK